MRLLSISFDPKIIFLQQDSGIGAAEILYDNCSDANDKMKNYDTPQDSGITPASDNGLAGLRRGGVEA